MTENYKRFQKNEVLIDYPIGEVWAYLCEENDRSPLFTATTPGSEVVLQPYLMRMSTGAGVVELQLHPHDSRTLAVLQVLRKSPEAFAGLTDAQSQRFVDGLKAAFSPEAVEKRAQKKAAEAHALALERQAEAEAAAQIFEEDAFDFAPTEADTVPEETADAPEEKPKKHTLLKIVTLAVAVLAVAVLAIRAVSWFDEWGGRPAGQNKSLYSALVTMDNAFALSVGDSRSDVESLLGTKGGDYLNGTLYLSTDLLGTSEPRQQIYIEYDGTDRVARATWLDLEACRQVNALSLLSTNLKSVGTDVNAVNAAVGMRPSMYRLYSGEAGETLYELHYGAADIFANFSPAWRGEYAVTVAPEAGTVSARNWVGYDGSDPLLVESLHRTALAAQYDDYDTYLTDKFHFDYSLLMLNKYSIGDARRTFSKDLALANGGGGMAIYTAASDVLLPDGTPAYHYSFGFDSANYFKMSSFVNMRLFRNTEALAESGYKNVTVGMSYNEVRTQMGILPTALIVDENFFSLCYGSYLDTPTEKEQFQFIVKVDMNTNMVKTVYDNTLPKEENTAPADDTDAADTDTNTPADSQS